MVFRCFYCTFWIPLLHSHTMWYILFYVLFCTSYSYTHCQTLQNNIFKYNLKNNSTLFSSIAHGFFNILTAQMVNDLNDTQNKKPKNPFFKPIFLDHLSDTSTNLINPSPGITSPPPFYTKRPNKLQIPKFKLFPKRHHFSQPKITFQSSSLPPSEQHPSLPNYSTPNSHPNDNITTQHDTIINTSVTSNTDTPNKIYSRVNYPFSPPSS